MSSYSATLRDLPLELTLDLETRIHDDGDTREVQEIRVQAVKLGGKPITLNLMGENLADFLLRLAAKQNPHIEDANEWEEG